MSVEEKFSYDEFDLDETIKRGGTAGYVFAGYLVFSTAMMFTPALKAELVGTEGMMALYIGAGFGLGLAAIVAFLSWRIRARHKRGSAIALFVIAALFLALILVGSGGLAAIGLIDILVFGSTLFLSSKAIVAIGKYDRTFGDKNLAKEFD